MLGVHLHHGIWSAVQTLGLTNNARERALAKRVGLVLAADHRRSASRSSRSSSWSASSTSRECGLHDRHARHHAHQRPVAPRGRAGDRRRGRLLHAGDPIADTKAPGGPLDERWDTRQFEARIANPANRRRLSIIVVGTGLAGASAAATLGEAGYVVKSFCYQDSPRRAHSIAAQGGINAAKNYKGDGDSVYRLFYDTIKGGDYRSRESNVYRLAAGEPEHHRPVRRPGRPVRPRVRRPARQPLLRRRAGLPHLLRPRPDRPAAAHRRLPGPRAPGRRRHGEDLHPPRDGRADRRRRPGPRHHRARHGHRRDRDLLRRRRRARQRRLRQRLLPLHQRDGLQRHRHLAGAPQGRLHGQPLLHPDPPDLHPGLRHPPVEADPDERVAAQRRPDLGAEERQGRRQGPARDPRGGPRLLPGADLPGLRQPGPPRHRLPPGQEHVRRGPRRRPRGRGRTPRRLPRLRRGDRAARPQGHRGQVRQPLRHVRPDHGRGPLRGPDADLPRRALRDGRPLGRLRPAVDDPRAVRDRRGQLLRPRRQPARRLGADAGPGRRLLRAVEHDPRLPRRRARSTRSPRTTRRSSRPSSRCRRASTTS